MGDRLTRWAFNGGAILGSVCLVFVALTLIFGLKPLIFTSGSMSPGIPTGSMALAVPMSAADTVPGQVVSVVNTQGSRITHRVVSAADGALVLKGDANALADLEPYAVDSVDRVLFNVPGLGFVISWFSQPWVAFLAGLLCALLIFKAFILHDSEDRGRAGSHNGPGRHRHRKEQRARRWLGIGALVTAIALTVPLGAAGKIHPTQAAFEGKAVASATLAAAVMPAPSGLDCQDPATGNKSVTVKWVAPSNVPVAIDHYKITVTVGGKTSVGTVPSSATSQILSLTDAQGLLGGLLALLGNLLEFLLNGPKAVGVSVMAVYPGGWESTAISNSSLAEISSYALVSTRILCK